MAYEAVPKEAVGEQAVEIWGRQLPPYFERFIEERDRRITTEFKRLEAAIDRNAGEIARLIREMERRFAELKEEMERRLAEAKAERKALREEMERRFAELRGEMDRRFSEAKAEREALRREIQTLRAEMHAQFRWVIGLLFPLVIGMLIIIARVFFGWPP